MKNTTAMLLGLARRTRFFLAVTVGLGTGWAMSKSLGPAVSFAIGGGITVALLSRPRNG